MSEKSNPVTASTTADYLFKVSKSLVQKFVKQQQTEGNLQSKQREKPQFSQMTSKSEEVRALVAEHPDADAGRAV
ncbi:hypothetical protein QT971_16155 [Microcoleus sp. herbarium19]|uniref:hypothetical protein n=1 Tax=unclassified Microcoleus TaxID=2642155 RepID=UPI002FCEAC1C